MIMRQRQVGLLLLVIGVVLMFVIMLLKLQESFFISTVVTETGTCYLEDGTCLHEKASDSIWIYIIGGAIASALTFFGMYLAFFDKSEENVERHHKEISHSLQRAKEEERKKDEFKAFMAGFTLPEQKILKAIYEQDGIKQSTLRFKADISKTELSLLLKSLEERGFVRRKDSGKTKEVYFVKKF
jgi:DNA-binding MarR family transcriptional regulator